MFQLKLTHRIIAGYTVPLLILSGMAVLVFFNVENVKKHSDNLQNTDKIIDGLGETTRQAIQTEHSLRGYLANQKPRHLESFENSAKAYQDSIHSLSEQIKILGVTSDQQRQFEEFQALGQELQTVQTRMINLARQNQLNEAINLFSTDQSSEIVRELEAIYDEFVQQEKVILAKEDQQLYQELNFLKLLTGWGAILALLFSIWFGRQNINNIRRLIYQAIHAITVSASEIAATIEEQERISTQQAVSVTQTTSAMNELNASSVLTSEKAELAATDARHVLALVDNVSVTHQNLSTNSCLREKVHQIANHTISLSDKITQIDEIANLVSHLAAQTNILSLNAAVEAVKAGEYGKGFGVVASEIRKLAEQSRSCATQINKLVQTIQKATQSTVIVTEEGTKTVDHVVMAINDIVTSTQQISLNAKQQAIAVQQVFEAMNVINTGAQETANGVSQVKLGAEKLNNAAQNLNTIV